MYMKILLQFPNFKINFVKIQLQFCNFEINLGKSSTFSYFEEKIKNFSNDVGKLNYQVTCIIFHGFGLCYRL